MLRIARATVRRRPPVPAMAILRRAVLAAAAAVIAACAAPRAAEYLPCELRCEIRADNPTGYDLTVYYYAPRASRVFLGELRPGSSRTFTVPEEEARTILVVFERAGRAGSASRRVRLRPGEAVFVQPGLRLRRM